MFKLLRAKNQPRPAFKDYWKQCKAYLRENQQLIFVGVTATVTGYYFNKNYLRKLKGIKKFKKRFQTIETDKSLDLSLSQIKLRPMINLFSLLFTKNSQPLAIVFPKNFFELEKIIKYAQKYQFGIINEDISDFDQYSGKIQDKYFIIVNQKLMKEFEFHSDNDSITVGAGITLAEINEQLKQFNSYLPVSRKDSQAKLFQALNHNNIIFRHPLYDTLKDLTNYLTVVLPNGQCTNSSSFQKSLSVGSSLNDLFIGTNATLGIIGMANISVLQLPKQLFRTKITLLKNEKSVIQNKNIFNEFDQLEEVNDWIKIIEGLKQKNNIYSIRLVKKMSKPFYFKITSLKELNCSTLESNESNISISQNEYNLNQSKIIPIKSYNQSIHIKLPNNVMIKAFEFFQKYQEKLLNVGTNYKIDCNIMKGDLMFNFQMPSKLYFLDTNSMKRNLNDLSERLLKFTMSQQGLFIKHTIYELELEFKQKTLLQEFGKNLLNLQKQFKQLLDEQKIFLNENYLHPILQ